ncbi:MAG: dCTP deaminase, partial [Anaerolineae bacterium]|nr:dCTP deaminase [Anaerolineae bacterium]
MGLKPDHWIRKMALEHGMIEPFVENQVRQGVISYGVSSYGYDMRVADEFKIFTNVYNAIVDPKQFAPDSFVDFKGAECVIPPNSFALARSVEYFRIPRSVLTLTVGKSTYARCFRGDTKVALVDGSTPTLEEMAKRADSGEIFFGYSIGSYGRIIVTQLEAPRYIGRDSLMEVILDNNESVYCTPDHQFIMRDGRLMAANELRPGDSLMPLYRKIARGYEMVYQPLNGQLHPTHRLADEWNLRQEIYPDTPGTHRHHIDHNRLNNVPWNIMRMDASEHIRHHNNETYGDDFDPGEHSLAIREAIQKLWEEDTEWRENYSATQREKIVHYW